MYDLIEILIFGIELVTGDWEPFIRLLVMLTIEGTLFAGIIHALEAMLLRGGREVAIEEHQMKALDEMRAPDDYRSLRRQRMDGR